MTRNQRRAVMIAEDVRRGSIDAASVSDRDWHLLLLAGNLVSFRSPSPRVVCDRVLDLAQRRAGYFSEHRLEPSPVAGLAVRRQPPVAFADGVRGSPTAVR